MPVGYSMVWSGQYEYLERAQRRLQIVVPVTLAIILLLLYMNFRNVVDSLIVMLSLPFALVGGVWLMYLLDYDFSIAVGVGFIALAGVAAETGVVMLLYLKQAYRDRVSRNALNTRRDLYEVVMHGAVERVRAQDDDGGGHHRRPDAYHVGHGHRFGGHAAHRRAHGRRHGDIHGADPRGHPGHLLHGQVVGVKEGLGRVLRRTSAYAFSQGNQREVDTDYYAWDPTSVRERTYSWNSRCRKYTSMHRRPVTHRSSSFSARAESMYRIA